jgi:hypothetical protein
VRRGPMSSRLQPAPYRRHYLRALNTLTSAVPELHRSSQHRLPPGTTSPFLLMADADSSLAPWTLPPPACRRLHCQPHAPSLATKHQDPRCCWRGARSCRGVGDETTCPPRPTTAPRPHVDHPTLHLAAATSAGSVRGRLRSRVEEGEGGHREGVLVGPQLTFAQTAAMASACSRCTIAEGRRTASTRALLTVAGSGCLAPPMGQIWPPSPPRVTDQREEEEPHHHHPCGPLGLC